MIRLYFPILSIFFLLTTGCMLFADGSPVTYSVVVALKNNTQSTIEIVNISGASKQYKKTFTAQKQSRIILELILHYSDPPEHFQFPIGMGKLIIDRNGKTITISESQMKKMCTVYVEHTCQIIIEEDMFD